MESLRKVIVSALILSLAVASEAQWMIGNTAGNSTIYNKMTQAQSGWVTNHDPGTPGSSSGSFTLVSSPSLSGNAFQASTTFSGYGGQIYFINFATDSAPLNFSYDGYVYIPTAYAGTVLNLEMDMNQVVPGGDTIIYGIQCDGGSGTWDYTENSSGNPVSYVDTWVHSAVACNPSSWTTNAWHHIQFTYSRDNSENVTYHSIWFDGTQNVINATVYDGFTLGWAAGALVTNFQMDGNNAGSNVIYLDQLTIARW